MRKYVLISLSLIALAAIVATARLDSLESATPPGSPKWTRIAPYSDINWDAPGEDPYVLVDGQWYVLKSIAGLPIKSVQKFAIEEYGDWEMAEKRIAEDIYDVLVAMGVEQPTTVGMKVQLFETGRILDLPGVPMTAEKRSQVYRSRNEL